MGTITVGNSNFTDGKGLHVEGVEAGIEFQNVHMYNSTDKEMLGHGLACTQCTEVFIADSTFEGIQSSRGGAIYLETLSGESAIVNSEFKNNSAIFGGAIQLINTVDIHFENNTFEDNSAKNDGRTGEGGAIYYSCDPVIENEDFIYNCEVTLRNNTFIGNTAERKGGSLRYTNKNFTMLSNDFSESDSFQNFTLKPNQRLLQSFEMDSNTYLDNYAPYGSDLASIPARIRYEIPPNDGGNKIFYDTKTLQIASGQEF